MVLEQAVDRVDERTLPWLRASLLIDLADLRERSGDRVGAAVDAAAASDIVATLDVVLSPTAEAVLKRLTHLEPARADPVTASLTRDGKWWIASCAGTSVRLQNTKGLGYLALLVAQPGVERHVLDLVDRIEGVSADGLDRRALGDAGALLDAHAAHRVPAPYRDAPVRRRRRRSPRACSKTPRRRSSSSTCCSDSLPKRSAWADATGEPLLPPSGPVSTSRERCALRFRPSPPPFPQQQCSTEGSAPASTARTNRTTPTRRSGSFIPD